eukprot:2465881-Pleurochrysis_carterae.AAC.1
MTSRRSPTVSSPPSEARVLRCAFSRRCRATARRRIRASVLSSGSSRSPRCSKLDRSVFSKARMVA